MNLKIISSALLIAGLAAPAAFAETGTITFTGSITSVTCDIDGNGTGGPDFTVDLGGVNAGDFKAVGDVPTKVGFRIFVGGNSECLEGTKVYANFEPGALVDPSTGLVKLEAISGSADGVMIRLFNEDEQPIDIVSNQKWVKKTVGADNRATIVHYVGYERTGPVAAGSANGKVTYTVRFEA
ncbi:type 1 fimbrial protein [Luteibacter aegosomaticola]|uniref:fimbrial protein n=1 Tax=Luteibacter aegosomaticola TaxID=2911538 RepID=UPI001FFA099E|nr:fimbrial protein [Luteibacter aegosomaticola]UPG90347.1 type 1 fimbrial protein [Luteibacter aegosomaticola]